MNIKEIYMFLNIALFLLLSCTSNSQNKNNAERSTAAADVQHESAPINIKDESVEYRHTPLETKISEKKADAAQIENDIIVKTSDADHNKINRVSAVKRTPKEEKTTPKTMESGAVAKQNDLAIQDKVQEVEKSAKSTMTSSANEAFEAEIQDVEEMPILQEPKIEKSNAVQPEIKSSMHSTFDHQAKKYISANGFVDYAAWKSEESNLDVYLDQLSKVKVSNLSKNAQMAFWINLYNAGTIKLILNNYPVASIRDIDGGDPWKRQWIAADGKTLSLNNIEHDILRPQFKDARIHFAVNCAAKSCPPVWNRAWTEANVQKALNDRTKTFLNDAAQNKLSPKAIEISKIMEWYRGDFGNLISFINPYVGGIINSTASISFLDYDWSLNGK